MKKFLLFLYKIINLYVYFVVMACILLVVPNINPDYPLFHYIFLISGFYLIPPVFGISFAPMAMLVVLTLANIGISKLYKKFFADKESQVIVMSAEEFMEKAKEYSIKTQDKDSEQNSEDNEERKDDNQ